MKRKCQSKHQYATEQEAYLVGLHRMKSFSDTPQLWVYLCQKCNKWHLTKKDQDDHRKIYYL